MNTRNVVVALVAAGLLVQWGLTAQWRTESAALANEHQRILGEHRAAARRVAELERRAALRARVSPRGAAEVPTDEALQKIRSGVVNALGRVSHSRLEVRPGPAPAMATVSLSTDGSFLEIVDLVSTLARPGSGLVVQRVMLQPSGLGGIQLQLDAVALGEPS
jgi:hypothetical protein